MKAVESLGRVERERHVLLDTPLPPGINGRVRVIILVEDEADDVSEQQWLRAAARNGGFEFLDSPGEDLYTLADGKPFNDAMVAIRHSFLSDRAGQSEASPSPTGQSRRRSRASAIASAC